MKQPTQRLTGVPLIAVSALASFTIACSDVTLSQQKDSNDTPCLAPATWFSHDIKKPDAENFQSTSNCVFHQFSWQKFLWLTTLDNNGKARFESLYSDAAINPAVKNPKKHILGGVNQAGSHGLLVDKNGRAVYTSMMINDQYRNFVITEKLYTAQGMQTIPANMNFTVGAMSLKAAWMIVKEDEDTSRYYTTNAELKLLSKVGNSVGITDDAKTFTAKVALVGFHIAEVVAGHPEAIWATFEHVDNAPNMISGLGISDEVAERNYTFYGANSPASDCNANNANIISINENSQQLKPVTHVCRQYRLGGGSSVNQNNIDSLNMSVQGQLPANSVWHNYMEVGAIWFNKIDALKPNWNPQADSSLLTGSTKLSNSVIETFTQQVASENNCFDCHNSMAITETNDGINMLPGKNISTSHILLQNYLNVVSVER